MKESIYTIPISEAFETGEGCPFCRIHSRLEQHFVEYITGPAMMEPDVRIKTNEKGFCRHHYDMTLLQRNRLSVALMLQTRLDRLLGDMGKRAGRGASGALFRKAESPAGSCFVCECVNREFERMLANVAVVWARESDFKSLYARQEYICYPDYERIAAAARKKLRGADQSTFLKITAKLSSGRLSELKSDIDAFCNLYDYRNAGKAPGETTAAAIENAVDYLTRKSGC